MRKMIFWGATGQAKVLRECMQPSGLTLVALFDNNEHLTSPFGGVPLFFGRSGFECWVRKQKNNEAIGFLVAIGGDRGKDRIAIQEYLESYGLIALIAKHSTAFLADNAEVGSGSQILAHASVCVEASIGRGCIVNTGAIIDHECRIGDGAHIAPGARLAGCVTVGRFAMIGTGATVLPRIQIGEGAVVGAGAVVTKNVEPCTVVVGNPARILRRGANHEQ